MSTHTNGAVQAGLHPNHQLWNGRKAWSLIKQQCFLQPNLSLICWSWQLLTSYSFSQFIIEPKAFQLGTRSSPLSWKKNTFRKKEIFYMKSVLKDFELLSWNVTFCKELPDSHFFSRQLNTLNWIRLHMRQIPSVYCFSRMGIIFHTAKIKPSSI